MSKRILFVVDNLPRARFFSRFVSACQDNGVAFKFLAYRVSSFRHLHKLGYPTELLRTGSVAKIRDGSTGRFQRECSQALEVISNDAVMDGVQAVAPAIATRLEQVIQDFLPSHLFLWNGAQLVERLASSVCPMEVEKRYFEIANLPEKMFVDSQGVNAASSLYQAPDSLLATDVPSNSEYEYWRSEYYRRQNTRGVPQAKIAQSLQWERPVDAVASRLGFGFYPIGVRPMWARFTGKISNSSAARYLIDRYRVPVGHQGKYRFFPLQVSGDTQLLLNSDVGNLAALKHVIGKCQQDGMDLVVKIHPAENSRKELAQLESILQTQERDKSVFLSDQPTTQLIDGAERVYTINSTVGLEALIAGKPIEVLGRAFYQHFVGRPDLMKCYLLRYLVPFDYFNSDSANSELLTRIMTGWPKVASPSPAQMVCGQ